MNNSETVLCVGAFFLGLRHGLDWDHMAAIMDIVAAVNSDKLHCHEDLNAKMVQLSALASASCYALGHALIVVLIGLAGICFRANLPMWIDPIAERIIGFTLLIFGTYIFYSVIKSIYKKEEFQLISRWMMVWTLFKFSLNRLQSHLFGLKKKEFLQIEKYGPFASLGVGIIHGIGAETASQIILVAAVSSIGQTKGIVMLLVFVLGIILSNTILALLVIYGFFTASRRKPFLLTAGILVGIFSVIIGSFFITGKAENWLDLQNIFKS